jgi:hypothetical protein
VREFHIPKDSLSRNRCKEEDAAHHQPDAQPCPAKHTAHSAERDNAPLDVDLSCIFSLAGCFNTEEELWCYVEDLVVFVQEDSRLREVLPQHACLAVRLARTTAKRAMARQALLHSLVLSNSQACPV